MKKNRYSIAATNRWKKVSAEERSKRMVKPGQARQASMTAKERRNHALVMVEARKLKQKK